MKIYPHLVVCEHCDTVYRRSPVASGAVARCENCSAVLYRGSSLDVDRWLALTIAAAIAFAMANVCPVIRVGMQGLHNEATLWQSTAALAHGVTAPIAIPAACAVILVPLAQITLLGWVLAFARSGRRAPGFVQAAKMLAALRPWSMIEVCLLGILVAVIKLSSLLQVAPGAGIWAMATLMVLITLIASRDLHWLWAMVDDSASGDTKP